MSLKHGERVLAAIPAGERRSAAEISSELSIPWQAVYQTLAALYSRRLVDREVQGGSRRVLWSRPDGDGRGP
ncbi:MAG: helix-turn-helix transcriptional regulator [Chloroflexi bacterium]|nr:helix-turn-helix transcriptional regulator [Chloroflexota bacterium]